MVGLGILIVLVFLFWALGPLMRRWVGPWIQRWAMHRQEDMIRRMMGMPTRKEEKKARKQAGKNRKERGASRFRQAAAGSRRGYSASRRSSFSTVHLLQFVAEDVEFTEIKEYSRTEEIGGGEAKKGAEYREETQVEDAVYTEIKSR